MKECFCGCGRTIPRFPLGMRSINERGKLVAERLAWAKDVMGAEHEFPEWVDEGHDILGELRLAVHGDIRLARSMVEARVRDWQSYGRKMEIAAKAHRQPVVNEWLPPHQADVGEIAADVQPKTRSVAEIPADPAKAAEVLMDLMTDLSVQEFAEDTERALQIGALRLTADSDQPGDHRATAVSLARLGYVLRALEDERLEDTDVATTDAILSLLLEVDDRQHDIEVQVAKLSLTLAAEQPPSGLAVADNATGFGGELRRRVAQARIDQMFVDFPPGMTADDYHMIFRCSATSMTRAQTRSTKQAQ